MEVIISEILLPCLCCFQPSSGGSRDPVGHVLELKLKALILDTIHSIDVVQSLVHSGVNTVGSTQWDTGSGGENVYNFILWSFFLKVHSS